MLSICSLLLLLTVSTLILYHFNIYYYYYSLHVGQETNILSIFCNFHKCKIDNKDDFDFETPKKKYV